MSEIEQEAGAKVPTIKVYPDKFADHVMVVTGAGNGIGETTACLLAQQGAQVILLDIVDEKLNSVRDSITASGGKADSRHCDITNETEVAETINWIVRTYHKIDALINLAGIYPFHPLQNFPLETYQRIININLTGSFLVTRAILPHMNQAGYGRIIHTSSSTVAAPEVGLGPYAASKAGVVGLVRATAVEAGAGVTANVVMPGLVDTERVRSNPGSQGLFEHLISKQTVKRRIHPLDVAHAICFIASPEAAMFTGQIFDCSGGETFH